jgi:SPP1 family predicted phage head-tail adaptor
MGRGKGIVGKLSKRIVIQTPTEASDGQGGFTSSWGTFATVWAEIEPISAAQQYFAAQLQHRVTHKITIRTLASLTTKMRISFESRVFQLHSWRELKEDNRFMELMAEEGAGS